MTLPDRLTNLVINRVAFVPKGDNPLANIEIWKAAPTVNTTTTLGGLMKNQTVAKLPRITPSRLERLRQAMAGIGSVVEEAEGRKEDIVVADDTAKQFTLPEDTPEDVRKHVEGLEAQIIELGEAAVAPVVGEASEDPIDKALAKADLDPVIKAALESAKAANEAADEATATVAKMREENEVAKAIEDSAAWKSLTIKADEFGPLLRELRVASPDTAKEVERVLTAANAAASEAFTEIGKKGSDASDAFGQLQELGRTIAKRDGVTEAVGFAAALGTDEGKALHREYKQEVNDR